MAGKQQMALNTYSQTELVLYVPIWGVSKEEDRECRFSSHDLHLLPFWERRLFNFPAQSYTTLNVSWLALAPTEQTEPYVANSTKLCLIFSVFVCDLPLAGLLPSCDVVR
jgi:hypothetical protein